MEPADTDIVIFLEKKEVFKLHSNNPEGDMLQSHMESQLISCI